MPRATADGAGVVRPEAAMHGHLGKGLLEL
jgi:hypothetical protein